MPFFSDIFGRMGRVARGEANAGVDALEDATFETTVRQTVADMRTELNKVVNASAMAMSNYNRLDAEYQKYVRQSQEWKDRANVALDAGNEDLAKKALAKKAECDQQANSMQQAVASAQQASEKLKSRSPSSNARSTKANAPPPPWSPARTPPWRSAKYRKPWPESAMPITPSRSSISSSNPSPRKKLPPRRSINWPRPARTTISKSSSRNSAPTVSTPNWPRSRPNGRKTKLGPAMPKELAAGAPIGKTSA
jgi:hypothetical protein